MTYTILVAGMKDLPPELRSRYHRAPRSAARRLEKNDEALLTATDVINKQTVPSCVTVRNDVI